MSFVRFLKGSRCFWSLNNLLIPFHRMLLWDGKRLFFLLPLEWHKNKSVNSYYIHTHGLWGFFLWENITLSTCN